MKKIVLDFKNMMILFDTDNQKGSQYAEPEMNKTRVLECLGDIQSDITNMIIAYNNLCFDFENCCITAYQDIDYDKSQGCIYPPIEQLHPVKSLNLIGLNQKYDLFIKSIGYDTFEFSEDEINALLDSVFKK